MTTDAEAVMLFKAAGRGLVVKHSVLAVLLAERGLLTCAPCLSAGWLRFSITGAGRGALREFDPTGGAFEGVGKCDACDEMPKPLRLCEWGDHSLCPGCWAWREYKHDDSSACGGCQDARDGGGRVMKVLYCRYGTDYMRAPASAAHLMVGDVAYFGPSFKDWGKVTSRALGFDGVLTVALNAAGEMGAEWVTRAAALSAMEGTSGD